MNQSIQLAKLWTTLHTVKDQLDNVVIPLGIHLGLDDPELMIVLEELSAKIKNHFEKFKLAAHACRNK